MGLEHRKTVIAFGRYAVGILGIVLGALTIVGTAMLSACDAFGGTCDGVREKLWESDSFGGGFLGAGGVSVGVLLLMGRWSKMRVLAAVAICIAVGLILWYRSA